jgi:hypothetical protein
MRNNEQVMYEDIEEQLMMMQMNNKEDEINW